MTIEFFCSTAIIAGLAYWSSAKVVHETAYYAVRQRCEQLQVQMLDDYVALQHIRLKRSHQGRLELLRTYNFEFSSTGNERYHGHIILSGRQVVTINMDAYRVSEL